MFRGLFTTSSCSQNDQDEVDRALAVLVHIGRFLRLSEEKKAVGLGNIFCIVSVVSMPISELRVMLVFSVYLDEITLLGSVYWL